MTNMKRISIAVPDDVDHEVLSLRSKDEYMRCTYSEIIRRLVVLGLKAEARRTANKPSPPTDKKGA